MNAIEAARQIGSCLDEDGVPYAIGGALALGVWGVPRATKDVDLSVFDRVDELRWGGPKPEFEWITSHVGAAELWERSQGIRRG